MRQQCVGRIRVELAASDAVRPEHATTSGRPLQLIWFMIELHRLDVPRNCGLFSPIRALRCVLVPNAKRLAPVAPSEEGWSAAGACGRPGKTSVRMPWAEPTDMMISAFCVFRVANRHTFGALFGRDLVDPALREHYRTMLGDMIVDYISVP